VLSGFVSAEAARTDYGVVVDGDNLDAQATQALRENRPETRRFYRQEYVDALV